MLVIDHDLGIDEKNWKRKATIADGGHRLLDDSAT